MKKILKVLGLIIILTVMALMVISCGVSGSADVKKPSSVSTAEQSAETTDFSSAISNTATNDITIEEAVLFEQGGIKITAKSFTAKTVFGPEIKLLIENASSRPVTVQSRNTSVNGYMVETMMSADVAAGKKINDSLIIMKSDLDTAGITTVANIEFNFHIFDSETWDTICDSDTIKIETSEAEGFEYTFDNSGSQVYNDNGVEVVIKGLSESDSWLGPEVVVYISNTGNKNVTVQARDVSINGFMVESIFSSDVIAGKHAMDTITFLSSNLEENGIEKIESIELSFHVFDMDLWDTVVDTAPITINF